MASTVKAPIIRLRFERFKRGLTQTQLGRLMGWNQAVVSQIENGTKIPTPEELADLARALCISPPEVLLRKTVFRDENEITPYNVK